MASYKLSSPFPAVYDHVRHTVFMVGTATRATDSYAEFVIVVTICCCSHEWVVFVSTSRAVVIVITVIYAIIGRTLFLVAPAAVIVGASGAGSPRSAMRMRRHFPGGYILKGMIKMTIPAIKSFTNYNKYKTESGYTKQGELQQYMQNQNDCLAALTQAMLWQPETSYEIGKVITSPSMPTGVRAKVMAAGKTSDTEPTWTAVGTTVEDGTVAYIIESLDYTQLLTEAVKTLTTAIANAKKEALLEAHPVGSYYFSDDATNPGTLFGGTWEAIDPGYGLIAQGTATAEDGTKLTFTAGNKYGEFKHQLTVGEMPVHTHNLYGHDSGQNYTKHTNNADAPNSRDWTEEYRTWSNSMTSSGGNQYHNNLAPSIAIYCWRRSE